MTFGVFVLFLARNSLARASDYIAYGIVSEGVDKTRVQRKLGPK